MEGTVNVRFPSSRLFRSLRVVLLGAALVLLSTTQAALAQTGKLTGVVTDVQTGEALAGVQVYVEDTGRGALTSENGRYFIINLAPGTFTVIAELLGYATVRTENVQLTIDVTRVINFQMTPAAIAVEEIVVIAEAVPLIELSNTGSSDVITAEYIAALPIDDIGDVLALKSGFLNVPSNTDVISFAEERRGVTALRIRGGRGAETLTLIDGIPINNFVLGGPAINLTPKAVEQIDFVKGGFEPQYGNALSGFINIATREGGTRLEGAVEYRSTRLGDWLGNGADEVADRDLIEGYVSGSVPGTGDRLRFMFSGRQNYGPDRVLEFDDDVFRGGITPNDPSPNPPHALDVEGGWRAVGFDNERDALLKGTFFVSPTARISGSWLTYQRQSKTYDFRWQFAGIDPLAFQETEEDSAWYGGPSTRIRSTQFLQQNSVKQERDLYVLRWDHTLGRSAYQLSLARFNQKRVTCSVAEGVCLGNEFEDPNFDSSGFVRDGSDFTRTPTTGTDRFFGGEDISTNVFRADGQSQVSDHHHLRAGVFYQGHDVIFDEWQCGCVNQANKIQDFWQAEPWDAAFYLQDQIEYDFITINLGFRIDYGKAKGTFLANPLDPTNGTNALDVCDAGPLDCTDIDQRAEATVIAAEDDFEEAGTRSQFSPRIGVNLPVTSRSSLFFNYGRFSQNPLLKNLFQFTNVGTDIEGTVPALNVQEFEGRAPFLGNPALKTEQTSSYEVGLLTELGDDYALQIVGFAKDQFGLTGVRLVGQPPFVVADPGATYGSNQPSYLIMVNGDFSTTRGFEFALRRRVTNFWGFDINYQWSRATTNAADPERQRERIDLEGDAEVLREFRSEIDQPHVFAGALIFQSGDEGPGIPGLESVLRNSRLATTFRASSGLPYTPITDFNGIGADDRLPLNSARMPSSFQVDVRAQKDFLFAGGVYSFFVDIRNLLDKQNCIQVFESTGDCEGGTEDQARRRVSNGFSPTTNSTTFDRPSFIGQRRTIGLGLRVGF